MLVPPFCQGAAGSHRLAGGLQRWFADALRAGCASPGPLLQVNGRRGGRQRSPAKRECLNPHWHSRDRDNGRLCLAGVRQSVRSTGGSPPRFSTPGLLGRRTPGFLNDTLHEQRRHPISESIATGCQTDMNGVASPFADVHTDDFPIACGGSFYYGPP